jgi:hypothetical protein
MSVLSRYACGAIAVLAVAACDPRFVHKSDLSVHEVEQLSGWWSGQGYLTFSNSRECVKSYLWTLRVEAGNVNGKVVDAATPDAIPATFETFVEYDGTLHASIRTRGTNLALLGSFNHRGFEGTARSEKCIYTFNFPYNGSLS